MLNYSANFDNFVSSLSFYSKSMFSHYHVFFTNHYYPLSSTCNLSFLKEVNIHTSYHACSPVIISWLKLFVVKMDYYTGISDEELNKGAECCIPIPCLIIKCSLLKRNYKVIYCGKLVRNVIFSYSFDQIIDCYIMSALVVLDKNEKDRINGSLLCFVPHNEIFIYYS
ncbi:hypothetical protein CR513_13805, partial [Mucuna pruriens]